MQFFLTINTSPMVYSLDIRILSSLKKLVSFDARELSMSKKAQTTNVLPPVPFYKSKIMGYVQG